MGGVIVVFAFAGILMGAGAVAFVMARAPRAPEAAVATAPAASASSVARPPASAAAPRPASTSAPKWTGGVERTGRRTRTVFFELAAENEIGMWTRRVRPVLSVRCVDGSTEAYVLTQSAAVIEGDKGSHTVTLEFDGGPAQKEAWFASDDYQALFSPDARALARRIAGARTVRFGFLPYNGSPAVAEFDVRGFDALIGRIAKSCRWK